MWIWLIPAALGAEATVAVKVTDPGGKVRVDRELPAPVHQVLDFNDGRRSTQLEIRAEPATDALVVSAVLAEFKASGPKPRANARASAPEAEPTTVEITRKHGEPGWKVEVLWIHTFEAPAQNPAPTEASRFILFWDDAPLRADPRTEGEFEQIRELPEGRTDVTTQVSPFKAIHRFGGDWMEVETVPNDYLPHCYRGGDPPATEPHQHYAKLDDALKATSRELSADFSDGTGYVVAAGVAVEPSPDREGAWRVRIRDLSFDIIPPQESVNEIYMPSGHFSVAETGWVLVPDDDAVVGTIGGNEVRWLGETPPVVQGRRGIQRPVVTLRVPCAEVRVLTSIDQLTQKR